MTDIRAAWEAGRERELTWWRNYLASGGLDQPDEFRFRFDGRAPLQPHVARLLPRDRPAGMLDILDCASGPATTLGKTIEGEPVRLVAVDAHADEYAGMLEDLGLRAPVPSRPGEVERLGELFAPESFDLVYMRFALDHCYGPAEALRQMYDVTRAGGTVLIEHYREDGDTVYQGLRQWALHPEPPGELVIFNRHAELRLSEILPTARIEVSATPTWLTVTVRKPS